MNQIDKKELDAHIEGENPADDREPLEVIVAAKDRENWVFVEGQAIGAIRDGYFVQRTTKRHLFRSLNSKGIEYDVYQRLLHEPVSWWRLEFTDTNQILEIPFAMIPELGILNPPYSAGYQYHVKLQYFNETRAALQKGLGI